MARRRAASATPPSITKPARPMRAIMKITTKTVTCPRSSYARRLTVAAADLLVDQRVVDHLASSRIRGSRGAGDRRLPGAIASRAFHGFASRRQPPEPEDEEEHHDQDRSDDGELDRRPAVLCPAPDDLHHESGRKRSTGPSQCPPI